MLIIYIQHSLSTYYRSRVAIIVQWCIVLLQQVTLVYNVMLVATHTPLAHVDTPALTTLKPSNLSTTTLKCLSGLTRSHAHHAQNPERSGTATLITRSSTRATLSATLISWCPHWTISGSKCLISASAVGIYTCSLPTLPYFSDLHVASHGSPFNSASLRSSCVNDPSFSACWRLSLNLSSTAYLIKLQQMEWIRTLSYSLTQWFTSSPRNDAALLVRSH